MDISTIKKYLEPIALHFDVTMLEHLDVIAAHVTPRRFRAGERFPQPGQSNIIAGCVIEGIFRTVSIDAKKKENTVRFGAEGDFSLYIDEHKNVGPNHEYRWEAITDAVMLTWEQKDLEFLARNVPNWYLLNLKILNTIILRLTVERGEMFTENATIRYQKFATRYPQIIARVPLRYVANYLGIAPQSLSRIRQQLINRTIN